MKKTAEQLVLPRVSCSGRRIKAAFGPLVKSNIHVGGKTVASPAPKRGWKSFQWHISTF